MPSYYQVTSTYKESTYLRVLAKFQVLRTCMYLSCKQQQINYHKVPSLDVHVTKCQNYYQVSNYYHIGLVAHLTY